MTTSGSTSLALALAASLGIVSFAAADAAKSGPRTPPASDNDPILRGPRVDSSTVRGLKEETSRPGRGHRGKSGKAMVMKALEQANLTEDQKTQVKAAMEKIRESHRKGSGRKQPELRDLHEQMRAAREKGDREAMRALHAQAKKIMGKGAPRQMFRKKLASILTPDQLERFQNAMKSQLRRGQPSKCDQDPSAKNDPEVKTRGTRRRSKQEPHDKTLGSFLPADPANVLDF